MIDFVNLINGGFMAIGGLFFCLVYFSYLEIYDQGKTLAAGLFTCLSYYGIDSDIYWCLNCFQRDPKSIPVRTHY